MMLFKFDFNHAILNFKTIALMKFSFDLNHILIWSRDYVLFNWNVKNGYQKNLKKLSFTSFDQLRIPFDRSNVSLNQSKLWKKPYQTFWMTQSTLDSYSIDQKGKFDQSKGILNRSRLVKLNFSDFSGNHFLCFTWTKHSPLVTSKWDWDQNWISLML